jgi:hypothetical protein
MSKVIYISVNTIYRIYWFKEKVSRMILIEISL